jgi:N-formylglutamate amidohydrolase
VQLYSNPHAGRHSLQVEINKRLYMDEASVQPHAGFEPLQRNLMHLIDAIVEHFSAGARP